MTMHNMMAVMVAAEVQVVVVMLMVAAMAVYLQNMFSS